MAKWPACLWLPGHSAHQSSSVLLSLTKPDKLLGKKGLIQSFLQLAVPLRMG